MTTTFTDAANRSWTIRMDGLLLADLRQQHGINLADLSAGDYLRIENDAGYLVTAVCHLLRDALAVARITRAELAAALVGESLEQAAAALLEAAQLFFPPKARSALASNLAQLREQHAAMGPALAMLSQPNMPPIVVETLTSKILAGLGSTVSLPSTASASAGGPAANQSPPATD